MTSEQDNYKRLAAEAAVAQVPSGTVLGLGHGSTVNHAIAAVARRLKDGELNEIVVIGASEYTESECQRLGIPVADINDYMQVDLTIDGADEIDPDLNLIKGGGGALTREKLLAQASRKEIIIADHSKLVKQLGGTFPLPLEVIPYGWKHQAEFVKALGADPKLRYGGALPARSDQGNYLLDCDFGPIEDLAKIATALEGRTGIVEHGLFLGLATEAYVAGPDGIQHLTAAGK